MKMRKPVVLMILDGFGLSENVEGNAVKAAKTPNIDMLMDKYPFVRGYASGLAVGLPDGQMGNSEVGHLNMGAGRIVYQDLTRITKEIEDGTFFENGKLTAACEHVKETGGSLHLYGLLSDGGVHSHNTHLYGLLELAKRQGIKKVYIHCFMDGRDTSPTSGLGYIEELLQKTEEIGVGEIATVVGRYYAMDRDNRWERVEEAYNALVAGEGKKTGDVLAAVKESYDSEVTDEFIKPIVCDGDGRIKAGDSIIFFNFRPDRARQLTRVFCDPDFKGFSRERLDNISYTCFTEYDVTIPNKEIAFEKVELNNTFGEYLAAKGLKQARIAETEKYAHVTFFFNGGVEKPNSGEERILVNSPKVATYDLKPEMSAYEVCDKLCGAIESDKYDVIIINFANPDMVGHTGVFEAAVSALEAIDECVGRAYKSLIKMNGVMFLCADHGNSEQLIDPETKEPFTAHTTNPVPFVLINYDDKFILRDGGRLCDIVPTLIDIMGLEKPAEMTGESLLVER